MIPPDDLLFRLTTRVRATGYWLREKVRIARRLGARAAHAVARAAWIDRSTATRTRSLAVVVIVALYAVIRFLPVPGVPCGISAAKECAPADHAVALVPADALLYAHLTLDRDSHQYELASESASKFPDLGSLVRASLGPLPTPTGAAVDLGGEILPWADGDLALAELPAPRGAIQTMVIAGVGDRERADAFLARVGGPNPLPGRQHGDPISLYPKGFAAAYVGDELAFGDRGAVRAAIDAAAGRTRALGDAGPRGDLPDVRFADIYLSRAGIDRLLAGGRSGAAQLGTFVDYGATRGMAASATARDDGVDVNLVSDLDPSRLKRFPTAFAELPEFHPDLAAEAGDATLAYVGVGNLGPTLASLVRGAKGGGLAASLAGLAKSLQVKAGVNPIRDLLPALGGQAALVVEPTAGVPFASLIVDDVDQGAAAEAMARLEGPILRSLKGSAPGQVLRFEDHEVDGVTARSVRVSPAVDLSYAIFDGKLVISTDPAGIAQVKAGGGLAGTAAYRRATHELPDEVSALVFLNLDQLLELANRAGLVEDPVYASLSDDISNIQALGLAVNGGGDQLRSELFLSIE